MKRVFFFGEGEAEGAGLGKETLGGKGSGLAEMTALGIPVPPGFTIETGVCVDFSHGASLDGVHAEVETALARLEHVTEKRFGDPEDPLLVSVRSGARSSMPGMMDTILNLGLTTRALKGLAGISGQRFALDCRRRFLEMYGDVVLRVPRHEFDKTLAEKKREKNVTADVDLSAEDLTDVVGRHEKLIREKTGKPFPEDPREQLWGAIAAVFRSWDNERAKTYRKLHHIPDDWGTAVNVQSMVFGNRGETSATGVAFTRDPSTGERRFYGEFLPNAQGEDVVAGIRTPRPLSSDGSGISLEETMPEAYAELLRLRDVLEKRYRDMQDLEFTIEDRRLYLLQTRNGKRTGFAAVRIATEMVDEGLISEDEAIARVESEQLVQLLAPVFTGKEKEAAVKSGRYLGKGLPAGPGAACGQIAFTADRAVAMAEGGNAVVLVREETSPEDIAGMHASVGILTTRGGMTSHAAVVARGMGKTCVVGAGELSVDAVHGHIRARGLSAGEGEWISVDGSTGEVLLGKISTQPSEVLQVVLDGSVPMEKSPVAMAFTRLLAWADSRRRLGVRANADTPADARVARLFGAEGIGLCRTEHMFFEEKRILAVREMILADNPEGRREALAKILPMQREDFLGIFREMGGRPVTIRLLDPPLHEFLPKEEEAVRRTAEDLGVSPDAVRERVHALAEVNPMLGHRGCRLGITHPEIYETQVCAIFEAAAQALGEGVHPNPEIMIPLVGARGEFDRLKKLVDETARRIAGNRVNYRVGTMIEVPRAALRAGRIALNCDFFSFGTNDLTQLTYGYSRDDAASFLPIYIAEGILPEDPFVSLDQYGVGELVSLATRRGREAKPGLKIGICGEHGGDPRSIEFFHTVGLDYVSCSPFRVPVARLAAARSALAGATAASATA
ncbi:MAG: pyruvate, phosphate dikinase [Acidobacteria bacterium]|nr:pyruvate, phosphate dikinase [Acidobacteriota bacterium]MCA1612039.1 pyruvate, phosphate dikinase [Acidobacteriota bacterium]MCA1617220.1 pyruvate, phosphate dikinase [Acidobacteriota bacterium]